MLIEEQIAYGKVIVRIITRKDVTDLTGYLKNKDYRYTRVQTEGLEGPENLIFTVLPRENLDELLLWLKEKLPTAFFTVEKVNRAAEGQTVVQESTRWALTGWLRERKRV